MQSTATSKDPLMGCKESCKGQSVRPAIGIRNIFIVPKIKQLLTLCVFGTINTCRIGLYGKQNAKDVYHS